MMEDRDITIWRVAEALAGARGVKIVDEVDQRLFERDARAVMGIIDEARNAERERAATIAEDTAKAAQSCERDAARGLKVYHQIYVASGIAADIRNAAQEGSGVEGLRSDDAPALPVAWMRVRDDGRKTFWDSPTPDGQSVPLYLASRLTHETQDGLCLTERAFVEHNDRLEDLVAKAIAAKYGTHWSAHISDARTAVETINRVRTGMVTVPEEPTEAALTEAVNFAMGVSLHDGYGWRDYMRDLGRIFLLAQLDSSPNLPHTQRSVG